MNRRQFLTGVAAAAGMSSAAAQAGSKIRSIDIVHHTHLDVGYTALPAVLRDDQVRYLDAAVDCCQADPAFRWTVETLVELDDWWRSAPGDRRAALESLIHAGRMDVMGLPFNQTAFLNAMQWGEMLRWIPRARWQALAIRAAMQNDVNGFPRAGAMALLDHGIHHLLMGINADSGGPPFRRPDAFWWKLPDGRRLFVWLGEHYGSVMNYLAPAREGARYRTDEDALRAAHAKVSEHLAEIEQEGYAFDSLILTHTHPQHYDNGYPFPSLASFVAAWNRLQLTPSLRLTTATDAVFRMEQAVGSRIPTLEGEWTDWWANGDASGPREVAASRVAKRAAAAAVSPVFGPVPPRAQASLSGILRDLCLFDEHTWGAAASVSAPYSLGTLAQYVEKSDLAYRPMGMAQALLERRLRARIDALPEGVYAVNPTAAGISGWAAVSGVDSKAASLVDSQTNAATDLVRENGRVRCWLEKLPAQSVRAFRIQTTAAPAVEAAAPTLRLDSVNWPVSALWPGMAHPLFDGPLGHFLAVGAAPPADRRTITQLHAKHDAELRARSFRQADAAYGEARATETAHTLRFTQEIRHSRLGSSTRQLELWKREPRARLTVSLDRLSSAAPEVLFVSFELPRDLQLPSFSCGGVPFVPYRDQLRGTCRDYFAIDGWADYATPAGHWLWVTRDAPLVALGGPHVVELHQQEPANPGRIFAMIFDNSWHTNFVADSHGPMEFQFDLVWRASLDRPQDLAEALAGDPIMLLNPSRREEPPIIKHMFRP
jgi:Glycosyl hydrolases family 38 N-terminal domain